ncbi:hypothetical protein MTR67_035731 [Solanum verrucosum]|uniref:CCHC-type domain-containing protein n=1 Tax=Solanum verrucosum TaxID=315347 RepID=A0AAF0ZK63_SOLVR|nr:hypothetical protein MTR67_035731 [Solanum verrucosum]
MLEDIRINVMTKYVQNEDELMTWNCDWSLTAIEMYNEFLKIANVCELNFNGDDGYEVSEANDRHIVNLAAKKCTSTTSAWSNLPGRPRMNRKRDKDEALKRQTEWVAPRRGRKMTCSNCGIPGHNARGCHKGLTWKGNASETGRILEQLRKEKMDMRSNKEKKQAKDRHTILLIDEEDVEDFPLTSPQPTQDCASHEDEDFGLDVEDDIPWKPRDFSELNSRIQQRQKQAQLIGSRRINFLGDDPSVMTRHNNDKNIHSVASAVVTA